MNPITLLKRQVAVCRRCSLCNVRKRFVFGQGPIERPDVMFIGEGPCSEDEARKQAFAGEVGKELKGLCADAGITYRKTYLANICKCRPSNNRPPATEELQSCLPWLREQIDIVRPKVIVALGLPAVAILVKSRGRVAKHFGRWTRFGGVPLLSTYHPAYLLRWPPARKDALEDFKKVARRLSKERRCPCLPK